VLDDSFVTPQEIASLLDIEWEGQIGELVDHHLFSSFKQINEFPSKRSVEYDRVLDRFNTLKQKRSYALNGLSRRDQSVIDSIVAIDKQVLRKRHKRWPIPPPVPKPSEDEKTEFSLLGIEDPGFVNQWHLHNPIEHNDLNLTDVWKEGITGKDVIVALVDDGLDMNSEDLAPNYFAEGSWDFNDNNPVPSPKLSDDAHGTRCAGEIAAVKNDVCGVGVAFDAKVSGLRILSKEISDVDEATALNYEFHKNHIYSCSWGPSDDGRSAEAPEGLILKAFINGVKNGRNGKGSIFVFASGNGAGSQDNCNYDGYTNSIYTITVGSVDRMGLHPYYSEQCSAMLVTTYSSGSGSFIYTTDVGKRECTGRHGGTSAAAPIAAGVFALVLSIRPDLTWRDMQYLSLTSAIPFNKEDTDWSITAAGRPYSYKFGYGKLDAYTIIQKAKTFQNLGPQVNLTMHTITINKKIPHNDVGISSSIKVTQDDLDTVSLGRLEHVTVTVNIEHQKRGNILVDLTSPNKIVSNLGQARKFDTHQKGLSNWTFMSVKHWDENPIGEWTLQVRDTKEAKFWGVFIDWRIKFHGEQINAKDVEIAPPTPFQTKPSYADDQQPTTSNDEQTSSTQVSETTAASSTITSDSSVPIYPTWVDGTTSKTDAVSETGSVSPPSSPLSPTPSIIYAIFGTLAAVIIAIAIGAVVYFRKDIFPGSAHNKFFSRDTYEFSVLAPPNLSNNDDVSVPLRSGDKYFMTSRELFDAFGDSDVEDDGDEFGEKEIGNEHTEQYRDNIEESSSGSHDRNNIDENADLEDRDRQDEN
ncbi:10230_t:CDS:2, partial [Paraglomus brasilianum]